MHLKEKTIWAEYLNAVIRLIENFFIESIDQSNKAENILKESIHMCVNSSVFNQSLMTRYQHSCGWNRFIRLNLPKIIDCCIYNVIWWRWKKAKPKNGRLSSKFEISKRALIWLSGFSLAQKSDVEKRHHRLLLEKAKIFQRILHMNGGSRITSFTACETPLSRSIFD